MPFAYAGTRRRRNRDRRRAHDAPEHSAGTQNREGSPDAREERDPTATRRASSEESPTMHEARRNNAAGQEGKSGEEIGSQDLHDPGSRDPDAPPVDNRS